MIFMDMLTIIIRNLNSMTMLIKMMRRMTSSGDLYSQDRTVSINTKYIDDKRYNNK